MKELTQAWELYYHVFRKISKQLPQVSLEIFCASTLHLSSRPFRGRAFYSTVGSSHFMATGWLVTGSVFLRVGALALPCVGLYCGLLKTVRSACITTITSHVYCLLVDYVSPSRRAVVAGSTENRV